MKLPEKNNDSKYCVTLKELFGQDVDENICDSLKIVNQEFTRRNNTLYISGENDKINFFPTDDISIKGPNIKQPTFNTNMNLEINNPQLNIENKSEISVPSLNLNKKKSSESEIGHNDQNNFEIKIQLEKDEINNIPKEINSHITLKELFSKDINDEINLILIKKDFYNDNNNDIKESSDDYDRSNIDENIEGNIIPVNIDIKYKAITNSNDINNISPSKNKNQGTLNAILPKNLIKSENEYQEEEKKEEIQAEEDDDLIFPGEEDIKSLNMNMEIYNNNKINHNTKNENKDNINEPKEKKEEKEEKENYDDEDFNFELDSQDLI